MSEALAGLAQMRIPAPEVGAEIKRVAETITYILDAKAGALAYQLAANQKARAEIALARATAVSVTSQPAPLWQVKEVEEDFLRVCEQAMDLACDTQPEVAHPMEMKFRAEWEASRPAKGVQ